MNLARFRRNARWWPGVAWLVVAQIRPAGAAAAEVRAAAPGAGEALLAATVPGPIETETTFRCAGIKWFIDGDDDLDCTVQVDYRPAGSAEVWRPAQPLLRVEPGSFNEYGVDPGNLLAGSVFGLDADTAYDLRLVLADPDGGAAVETVAVRTRALPAAPALSRARYVIPGCGGGSGTLADPFRGLAAADSAARPGDVFVVRPGIYTGGAIFTASGTAGDPVIWLGEESGSAILDGEGTCFTTVNLSGREYVQLRNLVIRRPRERGIFASSSRGIVIQGCRLDLSDTTGYELYGIDFRGTDHREAFICDNVIRGPLRWEDGRNDDHYGVVLSGTGHIVCHNEICGWYDGILVGAGEPAVESSGCDVYGNEVYSCTDDGIETDFSRHNVRVFENRFTNVLCGLSCQPVFGGPVYFVRNVVYNWQLKPLKFHGWPTGIIAFHNTLVGADPRGWGGGQWRHTILRNNIIIGGSLPGHSGDPIALSTTGIGADLDYDGWYQAAPARFALFNDVFHPTLASFQAETGQETHARLLDIGTFLDAEEPPLGPYLGEEGFPPAFEPGAEDLRLAGSSAAIDAGIVLANINDGCPDGSPDLGAYEWGAELPVYGPEAGETAGVAALAAAAGPPARLDLYPNPFRTSATLRLRLASAAAEARVSIFDVRGRHVRTLSLGRLDPGELAVPWDGRDAAGRELPSGIYLCRFVWPGGETESAKAVLRR